MPSSEDPEIKKIFSKMLTVDEIKRSTIDEIIVSPIF